MEENYLLHYDSITGEIKGFYLNSVHGNNIPKPTIEITVEEHDFYMKNNGIYKINIETQAKELIKKDIESVSLDDWQKRIINLENLLLQQGGLI